MICFRPPGLLGPQLLSLRRYDFQSGGTATALPLSATGRLFSATCLQPVHSCDLQAQRARLASTRTLPALRSTTGSDQSIAQPALSEQQKQKLRQAIQAGRRNVPVNTLCKDLGLERHLVLNVLKHPEQLQLNIRSAISFPIRTSSTK